MDRQVSGMDVSWILRIIALTVYFSELLHGIFRQRIKNHLIECDGFHVQRANSGWLLVKRERLESPDCRFYMQSSDLRTGRSRSKTPSRRRPPLPALG